MVLVAFTVKSSLFKVYGKFESRVNTTSVFRTGEAAVGDMLTADMTEFLVTRLLEWLMVAPLITTVGLRVVERSAWLKASVKQTSWVEFERTGTQPVFWESPKLIWT